MVIQQIVSNESARLEIYKELVNCYHTPKDTLSGSLITLRDKLKVIDSKALPYINTMISELNTQSIDILTVEYTRLFIGPYSLPAPPYGSIYIEKERKVMGDSTMDALKHYQDFGLEIAGSLKEVPDHITIELEYLYFLIFKEIESIQFNDPEVTQTYMIEQVSFLTDHLNRWVPDFTKNIVVNSGIEFYRSLANMTKTFIEEDIDFLEGVYKSAVSNAGNR
ncbi:MAG: molecular chaperone TorD family protein [Pseudomonadota bacterium]